MKPGDWAQETGSGLTGQVLDVRQLWGMHGRLPTRLLVLWEGEAAPREVHADEVSYLRHGPDRVVVVSLRRSELVQLVAAAFAAASEGQADAACAKPLVEALGVEWTGEDPW